MGHETEKIFPDLNESPYLDEAKQIENIMNNISAIESPDINAIDRNSDFNKRFGLTPKTVIVKEEITNKNVVSDNSVKKPVINYEIDDNNDVKYDVITLPSEGKIYKHKKKKLEVAYLTTSDEDILTSTNLYKNGLMIPKIIRKKVLDKSIKTSELTPGDIDFIMIWLRVTAYGPNYSVIVKDPSGKEFESIIDLSKLKVKKAVKEPDDNGYFFFEGDTRSIYKNIKYKILSYEEQKEIEESILKYADDSKKHVLFNQIDILSEQLETLPEEFNGKDKIRNLIKETNTFLQKHLLTNTDDSNLGYTKNITSFMEKQVVEIDGINDPLTIKKMISNMPVALSRKLRKDILENTPGMDYEIEIKVPGGEPIKSFLQIGPDILWGLD